MEETGLSLFQGSDGLKLSTVIQREEEEEFLEEEKQRKAELKNLIENAFDDLMDDDDDGSTVNSSHYSVQNTSDMEFHALPNHENEQCGKYKREPHFQGPGIIFQPEDRYQNDRVEFSGGGGDTNMSSHYQHCFRTSPGFQQPFEIKNMDAYKKADLQGMEQLQILYKVRLQEIERLNEELIAEKESKNQILQKLGIFESEKEGAIQSRIQAQELLIASKEKISDLENEAIIFKSQILELEKFKKEGSKEFEMAQLQIESLKQTIATMERCDANINREKQMESLINTINTKHKKEVMFLQQQLDAAVAKYNKKDFDCNSLEAKLEELERKHSALVLDKCDTVVRQDSTVQALLEETNKERLDMNRKLLALQAECDMLRKDLEQYDNVSRFRLLGNSSSDEQETDSILHLGITKPRSDSRKGNPTLSQADIISKLKDELHRALVGQKAKRSEIRKLQEQIQNKELQIQEMKEKERIYLTETENLKGNMAKIMEQLKKGEDQSVNNGKEELILTLKTEIEHLESENRKNMNKILELESEIQKLRAELETEMLAKKKQGEDYLGYHDSEVTKVKNETAEILRQKEFEWETKLEYLLKECDEVKKLYIEVRNIKEKTEKLLEVETEKCNTALKEKNIIKDQLSIRESEIAKLEKQMEKLTAEKQLVDEQLKKSSAGSSIDQNKVLALEAEVERLQNELLELPKKQMIELEALKNELGLAKSGLIELEKELRIEFESEKSKIVLENNALKEKMKEKDCEIKSLLSKVDSSVRKLDISVMTEDEFFKQFKEPKVNKNQNSENVEAVVKEEIIKVEEKYRKMKDKELKEMEEELTARHHNELTACEERVKNLTIKYFSEEMKKLELRHNIEFQNFVEKERKIVEELKRALLEKQNEIKVMSENGSKEDIMMLRNRMEEDRNKAAEIMAQWAKEVQSMKLELTKSQKEISELRAKLHSTRKAAHAYKKRISEMNTQQTEKYKNMLKEIQTRVDSIVASKEIQVEETIQKIEKEYQKRERELKDRYEKKSKR